MNTHYCKIGYIVQYRRVGELTLSPPRVPPARRYEITGYRLFDVPEPWANYYNNKLYHWESVAGEVIEKLKKSSEYPIYEYRIKPIYITNE